MTTKLRIAVVGHTNTGKTSLMRTLSRNSGFGAVSNRPGTTRRVEGAALMVDGEPLIELFDTPGLEGSIGLLDKLKRMRAYLELDLTDTLQQFLDGDEAEGRFAQEAKTLSHLLQCDVGLYVIDARDRVLGRHRDELEILGCTAIPIVPVLNFVASDYARTDLWREQLRRVNMHAVADFDTMVLNFDNECALFDTLKILAARFRPAIEQLVQHISDQRELRIKASANLIAKLLIDTAAYTIITERDGEDQSAEVLEDMKAQVRVREQDFITGLLALHEFDELELSRIALPLRNGAWGFDPFSPEALRQFSISTGSAAAAGAAVGLTVDVLSVGLTLGVGTLIGVGIGAIIGAARDKGGDVVARLRGKTQLRVDDACLKLLLIRNACLVEALFRRGHANEDRLQLNDPTANQQGDETWKALQADIRRVEAHPEWSTLGHGNGGQLHAAGRSSVSKDIAARVSDLLRVLLDIQVGEETRRS